VLSVPSFLPSRKLSRILVRYCSGLHNGCSALLLLLGHCEQTRELSRGGPPSWAAVATHEHLYVGLTTLLLNLPSFGPPCPPYASVYPSVTQSALPSLHARLCTDQHFTLGAFLAARCYASLTADC
jgi:hypothetical protein